MKGNIKKLAVLVIITAIAMFIPVATTPVDVNAWNILGNYAFTGSNQCLVAPFGFDSNLNANPPRAPPLAHLACGSQICKVGREFTHSGIMAREW